MNVGLGDWTCPAGQQALYAICNGTTPLSAEAQAACNAQYTQGPGGMLIPRDLAPGAVPGAGIMQVQYGCSASSGSIFNLPSRLVLGPNVGLGGVGMAMAINLVGWGLVGFLVFTLVKE